MNLYILRSMDLLNWWWNSTRAEMPCAEQAVIDNQVRPLSLKL